MQNFVGGGAAADSRGRRLTISVCKSTVFIVGGVGILESGERTNERTNERTKGLNFIPADVGGSRRFDYIVT